MPREERLYSHTSERPANLTKTGKFRISSGVPEELRLLLTESVDWAGVPVDPELLRIRDAFEGGPAAISEKYHSRPNSCDPDIWEEHKPLLTFVNVTRPAARCWVAAVYAGDIVRNVEGTLHGNIIERWVNSVEYQQACIDWCENAIVYGTAVAAPIFEPGEAEGDEGEIWTWLPDPVYTRIIVADDDPRRVVAVIECLADRIQFYTLWGEGWMNVDGRNAFVARNLSWLPVEIAYGIDRRHRGQIMGLSLVSDSVNWSHRLTSVAFNVGLLQKQQTASIFVIIGELAKLKGWREGLPDNESRAGAHLELPEGFDAKFLTPDAKIAESIAVMKVFIGLQATSESIPQDVVDATLTQSVGSAEAARIRAIPLVQRTRLLVPVWIAREKNLILCGTAVVDYFLSRGQQSRKRQLAKSVKAEIRNTPQVIPESRNEITQDVIARVAAGLITPEDAIRELNRGKTPDEIAAIAAEYRNKIARDAAQKSAQQAIQGAAAFTPRDHETRRA